MLDMLSGLRLSVLCFLIHLTLARFGTNAALAPAVDFSALGLVSNPFVCALLQTHLNGPMAAFLFRSRDSPMKALGMVVAIISVLVGVTVMISTAIYMRNSKSNRIMPARRIIKRRPRDQQPPPWINKMPVFKLNNPATKFAVGDPEASAHQDHSISSSGSTSRPKPLPPSAPCLPPPPPSNTRPSSDRPRAVPTISGALSTKGSKKAKSGRRKEGNISSALVSELKMKLEQKIIESNKGGYY